MASLCFREKRSKLSKLENVLAKLKKSVVSSEVETDDLNIHDSATDLPLDSNLQLHPVNQTIIKKSIKTHENGLSQYKNTEHTRDSTENRENLEDSTSHSEHYFPCDSSGDTKSTLFFISSNDHGDHNGDDSEPYTGSLGDEPNSHSLVHSTTADVGKEGFTENPKNDVILQLKDSNADPSMFHTAPPTIRPQKLDIASTSQDGKTFIPNKSVSSTFISKTTSDETLDKTSIKTDGGDSLQHSTTAVSTPESYEHSLALQVNSVSQKSRRKRHITQRIVNAPFSVFSDDSLTSPIKQNLNGGEGGIKQKSTEECVASTDNEIVLPEGCVFVEPQSVDVSPRHGEIEGTRLKRIFKGGRLEDSIVHCTACNKQLGVDGLFNYHRHPILRVLICRKCYKWYSKEDIEQDVDGTDEQCRWCRNGGDLICCDHCHNSFCKACIRRNLGRKELSSILDADDTSKWKCYVCDPVPILPLINSCSSVLEASNRQERQFLDNELRRRRNQRSNVNDKNHTLPKGTSSFFSSSSTSSPSTSSSSTSSSSTSSSSSSGFKLFSVASSVSHQPFTSASNYSTVASVNKAAFNKIHNHGANNNNVNNTNNSNKELRTVLNNLLSVTNTMHSYIMTLINELRSQNTLNNLNNQTTANITNTTNNNNSSNNAKGDKNTAPCDNPTKGNSSNVSNSVLAKKMIGRKLWQAHQLYEKSFNSIIALLGSSTPNAGTPSTRGVLGSDSKGVLGSDSRGVTNAEHRPLSRVFVPTCNQSFIVTDGRLTTYPRNNFTNVQKSTFKNNSTTSIVNNKDSHHVVISSNRPASKASQATTQKCISSNTVAMTTGNLLMTPVDMENLSMSLQQHAGRHPATFSTTDNAISNNFIISNNKIVSNNSIVAATSVNKCLTSNNKNIGNVISNNINNNLSHERKTEHRRYVVILPKTQATPLCGARSILNQSVISPPQPITIKPIEYEEEEEENGIAAGVAGKNGVEVCVISDDDEEPPCNKEPTRQSTAVTNGGFGENNNGINNNNNNNNQNTSTTTITNKNSNINNNSSPINGTNIHIDEANHDQSDHTPSNRKKSNDKVSNKDVLNIKINDKNSVSSHSKKGLDNSKGNSSNTKQPASKVGRRTRLHSSLNDDGDDDDGVKDGGKGVQSEGGSVKGHTSVDGFKLPKVTSPLVRSTNVLTATTPTPPRSIATATTTPKASSNTTSLTTTSTTSATSSTANFPSTTGGINTSKTNGTNTAITSKTNTATTSDTNTDTITSSSSANMKKRKRKSLTEPSEPRRSSRRLSHSLLGKS